jgi:two-component system chemotaxis sensor kinase CheA
MVNETDFSEFLDVYIQEANEQIEKLDDGLLRLEKEPSDTDILNAIFRAAHTLKGSSATMGFTHIKDLTHDAENLLDALRSAPPEARSAAVDSLLATTAVLRAFVDGLQAGDSSGTGLEQEVAEVRARLAEAMPSRSASSESAPRQARRAAEGPGTRFEIHFRPDCQMPAVRAFMATQLLESSGNVLWTDPAGEALDNLQATDVLTVGVDLPEDADADALAARVADIPEIQSCSALKATDASRASAEPSPSRAPVAKKGAADSQEGMQTVRVAVELLDRLVNLVGELVVDRTGLALIEGNLAGKFESDESVQSLRAINSHLGRIVSDIHDEIMRMRMLPVGQVFRRYPRMVRDLCQKLGKKADLILEGEETGLDRSILEDIVDPLTHLLRNAVDHGIEKPQERLEKGKPETGRVVLSARHEEGHVVIEIEDDGKGIDAARVRDAAVARGVITAEAASKLDERDSLMLLFASGVSTAEKVTEISGRGVGMDVVKNNIEKLHGQIEVSSTPGQGSRFTVRLPLTLAIVPALIVRSSGRLFAIPLASVVSTTIEQSGRVHTIEGIPCVVVRNQTLPLISAASVFEGRDRFVPRQEEFTVVIVQSRGKNAAFAVDEMVGKMEIVVKSLGSYLGDIPGFSGAAILGDGHIALIVDVASMLEMLRRRRAMAA